MRYVILYAFINLCLLMQAQIFDYPLPISSTTTHITEKSKNGFFVAQKVKGKISGAGLYQGKDGSLYIGNFKDKVYNGSGMLLAPKGETISNCPGATFYVGKFKNGIKHGKGICYNYEGEPIYEGKFENDVPIENYGDSVVSAIKYFSDVKTEDFYYIGEFSSDLPYGFGAIFFVNGDFLVSQFLQGQRDGICTYIETDGNWFTEKVDGDTSTFISSSKEYASYVNQSKSEWNAAWKKALGSMEDWASTLASLSNELQGLSQGEDINAIGVNSVNNNLTDAGHNKANGINNQNDNKYNMSEQRSYNSDKSTYSKYDSMLSQAFAGNRNASKSEINSWQRKMKQLREKWENKGKSFPHSVNEDR